MYSELLEKVGRYRDAILSSLSSTYTAQERVEQEERAVGWAIFVILIGTAAGINGILKRLDCYWSRDDQAEAVEKYVLNLLLEERCRFEIEIQAVKSVPDVQLRPDEETRIRRRLNDIMREILLRNPMLKDLLTPES